MAAADHPKHGDDPRGPLAGVRVLDICHFLAGPYATLAMAEMGADVIKVEDIDRLDAARSVGPHFMNDQSVYFASLNWNKRSLAVRFADPDGYQVVKDLVRTADVVVDNFSPGVMAKLGLDYETLCQVNPRIICCSVSGFGRSGPYANRPAYDYTIQALTGVMSVTGEPGQLPGKAGISYVDHSSGLAAALSVCAALYQRESTGKGRFIDVSLLDVQVSMLSYLASWQLNAGDTPERVAGGAHPTIVPAQQFITADGHVSLFVGNDAMWRRLVEVLDDDTLRDEAYLTNVGRLENRKALVARLQAVFMRYGSHELSELLVENRVPCAPVNTVAQALENPQVRERGLVETCEHPQYGAYQHVRGPVPDLRDPAPGRAAPLVGENTSEILSGMGYPDEKIEQLLNRKVVSSRLS